MDLYILKIWNVPDILMSNITAPTPTQTGLVLRAIPLTHLVGRASALLTHILGVGGLENFAILQVGGPKNFVIR